MIESFKKLLGRNDLGECILSVPANLLLLGEYAVVDEGGHGIWLAPECRAILRASFAHHGLAQQAGNSGYGLAVTGLWQEGSSQAILSPENSMQKDVFPLLDSCLRTLANRLSCPVEKLSFKAGSLIVDTRALSKGYGSSAASTILLCCGLILMLIPPTGKVYLATGELESDLLQLAIEAHRDFQQGAGSGYDIAASLLGASGHFIGGAYPQAIPLALPSFIRFAVHRSTKTVKTPGAVRRYRTWQSDHPTESEAWKAQCQKFSEQWITLVEQAAKQAPDGELNQLRDLLTQAKKLGIALGSSIGVPADLPDPYKALGAGNEWGICFVPPCSTGCPDLDDAEVLTISREGLRVESIG